MSRKGRQCIGQLLFPRWRQERTTRSGRRYRTVERSEWVRRLPVLGGVEEDQAKLAELDLVAVDANRRLHCLVVYVGAVEASEVNDVELAVVPPEFGVFAAHGDFVEVDVAEWVSACGGYRLIQDKPEAGVGAAFDHQQGRARARLSNRLAWCACIRSCDDLARVRSDRSRGF